jgi:oligosaccharyltransferase complex subunit alpha (ribophorin I)
MTNSNTDRPDFYYLVRFAKPLSPSDSITLSVSFALLSSVDPLPAVIDQVSSQTIIHTFSANLLSAYPSAKQKAKLKLPGAPAEFTQLDKNADGQADPSQQGSTLTYGPYDNVKPNSVLPVTVRYDFTKPLLHASLLERDIEVSHVGGNIATEERYWLTNRAAKLRNHFSRVQWQMSQYSNPPSTAAKELRLSLAPDAANPYFIDDIGNVSTSRFRPGQRGKEGDLSIKPRYPIFGGWNYSFKVGWDANLSSYLRKLDGDKYVLKVPFLEGPRTQEGIEYDKVVLRVILPEGAT